MVKLVSGRHSVDCSIVLSTPAADESSIKLLLIFYIHSVNEAVDVHGQLTIDQSM